MSATLTPAAKQAICDQCRRQVDVILDECEGQPDPLRLELAASILREHVGSKRPVVVLTAALAAVVRCDDLLCPAFRAVLVDTLTTRARELRELLEEGR
jgi:hypothetical protein